MEESQTEEIPKEKYIPFKGVGYLMGCILI
jgi:hypothetical protein